MSSPFAAFSTQTPAQPANKFTSILQATPYALLIVSSIIIIVAVIVFIALQIRNTSLKTINMLKTSIIKANPQAGEFYISPAAKLPDSSNEFSISLWLYIENLSITDNHKIILYRGNPDTFANGKFFVFMDSKTNTLYASLRTTAAYDDSNNSKPNLFDIRYNKYFLQSAIDYVPLQRWVNIIYTVKDTVLTTYLDGEIYSVTSIYELPQSHNGGRPLPSKQSGDIMIGGNAYYESFDGYMGNLTYHNFSLNVKEARVLYKKGPYMTSWLAYLGLGNVGVRSPIYRISASDVK